MNGIDLLAGFADSITIITAATATGGMPCPRGSACPYRRVTATATRPCLQTYLRGARQTAGVKSRASVLTDEQWQQIAPFMPEAGPKGGRPHADHRTVMEGIVYRYRAGIPWRNVPRETFGPYQTGRKRRHRFVLDGTWDQIWSALLAEANANSEIDRDVSVDSTINRAHQHATNTTRPE